MSRRDKVWRALGWTMLIAIAFSPVIAMAIAEWMGVFSK